MSDELDAKIQFLRAVADRKTYRRIDYFEPYEKQKQFYEMGAGKRERLLMAGNQLGKCISGRTKIPTLQGPRRADELFACGEEFEVWAYDFGSGMFCPAKVTHAVRKPAEMLVRLWTKAGFWFECALDHRVMVSGSWRFVRDLLPALPLQRGSIAASAPPIHGQDAQRLTRTTPDSRSDYLLGSRCDDEPLRHQQAGARDAGSLQAGALRHSLPELRWGDPLPRYTSTAQRDSDPPSNRGEAGRVEDKIVALTGQGACTFAPHTTETRPEVRRLAAASGGLSRSSVVDVMDQLRAALAGVPFDAGNQFIAYECLDSEPIYDFTVPFFHNYVAAGTIHHNTEAGAAEAANHLTGEYPDGWKGRRFTHPVRAWIVGETAMLVRDVQQKKLCGPPGVESGFGTGLIPKASFSDKPTLARGVSDAYDTIQVRHKTGGVSTATFKSYEQGRPKFQGEPVDFVWCDEEPPMDIYSEILTRTTATKGMVYITFTPLKGMSDVVIRFLNEPSEDRGYVTMTIEDALHIPPEERQKIIDGYPSHEREARTKGVPMLGSGRIFQISEESITEPQLTYIPLHWKKVWGLDFGINHPFAAVLMAWDVDNDCVHILNTIRLKDQLPIQHAAAMKAIAAQAPVAWPHDGHVRDKGGGDPLSVIYKREGLAMIGTHATWPDGSISTEAGILEMQSRMTTNRLKVASHLSDWLEEFRMYHRKDGIIVKERDDLISATRIALMMKRYAAPVPLGSHKRQARKELVADGVDFPLD